MCHVSIATAYTCRSCSCDIQPVGESAACSSSLLKLHTAAGLFSGGGIMLGSAVSVAGSALLATLVMDLDTARSAMAARTSFAAFGCAFPFCTSNRRFQQHHLTNGDFRCVSAASYKRQQCNKASIQLVFNAARYDGARKSCPPYDSRTPFCTSITGFYQHVIGQLMCVQLKRQVLYDHVQHQNAQSVS